ncbi:MAG TPA: TetR/AcrR family transcriptional regulator, partial [Actinomycetota bacterium]|nr:TetR/AcrR family transcriptional regulator [Actinomycetota bacterium]
ARDAGYTRGALYHQFANKEELAIAVVDWIEETWYAEVGHFVRDTADPLEALIAVARGHAIYCRRDIARVMMTLRVEFGEQDHHPVGRRVKEALERVLDLGTQVISAARAGGALAAGPPDRVMALAYLGAVEGVVISLAGQAPFDEQLAESVARGVLGLAPAPTKEVS